LDAGHGYGQVRRHAPRRQKAWEGATLKVERNRRDLKIYLIQPDEPGCEARKERPDEPRRGIAWQKGRGIAREFESQPYRDCDNRGRGRRNFTCFHDGLGPAQADGIQHKNLAAGRRVGCRNQLPIGVGDHRSAQKPKLLGSGDRIQGGQDVDSVCRDIK